MTLEFVTEGAGGTPEERAAILADGAASNAAAEAARSDVKRAEVQKQYPAPQAGEALYVPPATDVPNNEGQSFAMSAPRMAEINAQQDFGDTVSDSFDLTGLMQIGGYLSDEVPVIRERIAQDGLFGAVQGMYMGEAWDKEAEQARLQDGVPYEYHEDIMSANTLAGAERIRGRILNTLATKGRLGAQEGAGFATLIGGLLDVDLPLTFVSGGSYGAAKVARLALRGSTRAGLSASSSVRVAGFAQGIAGGTQSAALVTAGLAAVDPTMEWSDGAMMLLGGSAFGGILGGLTKGDVFVTGNAARAELEAAVRTDAPSMYDFDINQMPSVNPDAPSLLLTPEMRTDAGESLSAAANPDRAAPTHKDLPQDPNRELDPLSGAIIDRHMEARHESGWDEAKAEDSAGFWDKVANTGFSEYLPEGVQDNATFQTIAKGVRSAVSIGISNYQSMYNSGSAVLNHFAANIFESSNGMGRNRATAAARMENYTAIMLDPASNVFSDARAWARDTDNARFTFMGTGVGISGAGSREFFREVMLLRNERRFGRSADESGVHQKVRDAADKYDETYRRGLEVATGREGEQAVSGFETDGAHSKHYSPYGWNGAAIVALEAAGRVTRASVISDLAASYRTAGMWSGKDAAAVAKATIARAIAKNDGLDMSMVSLFTADGKEWLREVLRDSLSETETNGILDRLGGAQHERGKMSAAKSRNELDMSSTLTTLDGSDLKIVDLLDQNLPEMTQHYARQMGGAGALARFGIPNRVSRKEHINAARAEQRMLGEDPMDPAILEAMFSHFNGGAVHGYRKGNTNTGIGVLASLAKRMTNIALLNKMGIPQAAELAAGISQVGLVNWAQRGVMQAFSAEIRKSNASVLSELAYMTGNIGVEHRQISPWLDLDDVSSADKGGFLAATHRLAGRMQWIQGYTSAFNVVRGFEQKMAALSISDKAFRDVQAAMQSGAGLTEKQLNKFRDLGLGAEDILAMRELINNGTIAFGQRGRHTFVDRLNIDQWPDAFKVNYGAAIRRNINQVVQKSMAGEQDAWMHTLEGSVLTHLKTFPLQAFQKQFVRNMRTNDGTKLSLALMSMSTAMLAIMLRDAIDGRDRSTADQAKAAFGYSNLTGWFPMVADPMMSVVGLDDYRFNPYGPYQSTVPPVFSTFDNQRRIPGALWHSATGEASYQDRRALKTLPYATSYFLSRAFDAPKPE